MRASGSATSTWFSRSRSGCENHDGYANSAFWILRNSVDIVGSSKGRKPATSTYRITPMDQTSAFLPS